MFHCYYTFIKPLDPTARFAICGAEWRFNRRRADLRCRTGISKP